MLGRKMVVMVIVLLLVLLIHIPSSHATENGDSWTFLVYMAADNTLSSYAADDLSEMMSIGSTGNLNIVVLYDSVENGDSVIYYIERGQRIVMEELGEVNMGSPSTLEYFLNWSLKKYDTAHYFLDFWDHGNFYGGICLDHGDWLTLREMRRAILNVENSTGKMIDVVGFDACRMGIVEVFYSLRNATNYVVASEKDEPASGWPYDWILGNIENKTPEKVANLVVDEMYKWSEKYFSDEGISTTMVAINMTRFTEFINVFNENLKDALNVAPYYSSDILNASREAERYELHSNMDLYDFMVKLKEIDDYKIQKLANNTMRMLDYVSYYRIWDCPEPSNGVHADDSHGVGIYFPQYSVASSYYTIEFAKDTYWPQFLNAIFHPGIEKERGNVTVVIENGTLKIEYQTNASYVDIYILNGDSVVYSGYLTASGEYDTPVDYGMYKVYIYAYDLTGFVIWTENISVSYIKMVKIVGKIYVNDELATGASVTLIIGNNTYHTVQNERGFEFILSYPSEIDYNTTFYLSVDYGMFHENYTFKATSLKGNDTIYLTVRGYTLYTWQNFMIVALLLIASMVIISLTIVKIKKKKRARRDSNPRPRD